MCRGCGSILITASGCQCRREITGCGSLTVTVIKRYFVNFRLEVYTTRPEETLLFAHDYDAKGKKVLLKFAGPALGDMLAWFPCAEDFREKHGCELYVLTDKRYCEILQAGSLRSLRNLLRGAVRPLG